MVKHALDYTLLFTWNYVIELARASFTTYGSPRAGTRLAWCWFLNPLFFPCPFGPNTVSPTHSSLPRCACCHIYLRRKVHEVGRNPKLYDQVDGSYRVIDTDGRVFKLRIGDDDVLVSSDRITPALESEMTRRAERVLLMTFLHPWTRTRMAERPRKTMTQHWKGSTFSNGSLA
jgi:hypothetical protein